MTCNHLELQVGGCVGWQGINQVSRVVRIVEGGLQLRKPQGVILLW